MKLEVGQFARLKSGYSDELGIGKIEFVANCGVATIIFKNKKLGVFAEDIIKASYNIIDILEIGDYVNGGQVREIKKGYIRIRGGKSLWEYLDNLKDIKSIVTHEQMEQMAYKVGE